MSATIHFKSVPVRERLVWVLLEGEHHRDGLILVMERGSKLLLEANEEKETSE